MSRAVPRVIFKQSGRCPHLVHRLKVMREAAGVTYEACPDCLTRRITVWPGGDDPDTGWLRTGYFTAEQPSILELPMEAA